MAKTRWEDLVDFSGVQDTKKEIQDLDKTFLDLFKTVKSYADGVNKQIQANIEVFKKIEVEVKKQNAATDEGQENIKNYTKQVIRLDRETDNLRATQQAQVNVVSTLNKSVKSLKEEFQKEKKVLSEANLETEEGIKVAKKAAANILKLKSATEDYNKAARGANSTLTAAKGSYNALSLEVQQLNKKLRQLPDAFGKNKQEAEKLQKTIFDKTQKLKDFDSAVNQNFRNVGNYSEVLQGAGIDLSQFASKTNLAILGVTALAAGFAKVSKDIQEFNKNLKVAENITGAVGDELIQITAAVQATAQTFEKDFNEVLRASNTLANEFSISQSEAIDKINLAFAQGGDFSGQLLDNLREYATQARSANLTLDQFIRLNIESERRGLFNDKLVDTLKEVRLRLADLTKGQREYLDRLGDTGKEVDRLFTSGKQSEAIQLLSQELVNLSKSGKDVTGIIANLFGAPGEDLGIKGLEVLATLKDVNTELTESQKITLEALQANERYNEQIGILGESFRHLGEQVSITTKNIAADFLELINGFNDETLSFFELLTSLISPTAAIQSKLKVIGEQAAAQAEKLKQETINSTEAQRLHNIALEQGIDNWQDFQKIEPERLIQGIADKTKVLELVQSMFNKELEETKENVEAILPPYDALAAKIREHFADLSGVIDETLSGLRNPVDSLDIGLDEGIADLIADDLDKAAKEDEQYLEALRKNREKFDEDEKARQEDLEEQLRAHEEIKQAIIQSTFDIISTGLSAIAESQAIRFENEISDIESRYEYEKELAGDNEAAIKRIEQQKQQEIKKVQREQAEATKNARIFESLINTAVAVTRAFTKDPTGILAAIVGIAGAAQTAIIASTPLPQFEKGGTFHEGGLAIFNEKGPELIETPSGEFKIFNSDGPAIGHFEPNTKFYTAGITESMIDQIFDSGRSSIQMDNERHEKIMKSLSGAPVKDNNAELLKEIKGLKNAIEKKAFNVSVHNDGTSVIQRKMNTLKFKQDYWGVTLR